MEIFPNIRIIEFLLLKKTNEDILKPENFKNNESGLQKKQKKVRVDIYQRRKSNFTYKLIKMLLV